MDRLSGSLEGSSALVGIVLAVAEYAGPSFLCVGLIGRVATVELVLTVSNEGARIGEALRARILEKVNAAPDAEVGVDARLFQHFR